MPSYPITVERLTQPKDDWEKSEEKWDTIASPYAEVQPLTGREIEVAASNNARHTHRFRFRWGNAVADMTTKDRINFRGVVFGLTSVVNIDERNEWIECMGVKSG